MSMNRAAVKAFAAGQVFDFANDFQVRIQYVEIVLLYAAPSRVCVIIIGGRSDSEVAVILIHRILAEHVAGYVALRCKSQGVSRNMDSVDGGSLPSGHPHDWHWRD